MPFITAENAVELGRKSGEARRNKPVSFLVPVPSNGTIIEPDIARTVSELLRITSEQIASARALLNAEPDEVVYCQCLKCGSEMVTVGMPITHRAQLLKALDALIERKSKLLGIPDPGCLKPSQSNRRPSYPALDPRPIEPVAQPVPTTNSVPPAKP